MESGEKEKGIATLKEALKYAPNYLPLRTALYRFYAGEKNLPMARQELEEIVLINPYYPEIKKCKTNAIHSFENAGGVS